MMSTPTLLSGDVAGTNTSGIAPDTFAAGGNEMTRESATVELTSNELLHGSVVVGDEGEGKSPAADAEHSPADAGVVPFAPRQRQAVHPAVFAADAAQQQPPRHTFVAQSKGDAHVSPGEKVRHDPLCIEHVEHERSADVAEQQKPPRHADEAHAESDAHIAPGGSVLAPPETTDADVFEQRSNCGLLQPGFPQKEKLENGKDAGKMLVSADVVRLIASAAERAP